MMTDFEDRNSKAYIEEDIIFVRRLKGMLRVETLMVLLSL